MLTRSPRGKARAESQAHPELRWSQDVDKHVAQRLRERRVTLGLSERQLGELIGVSYQQIHKYETSINRVTANRLHRLACALRVEVGYFFEGLEAADAAEGDAKAVRSQPTPQQQKVLELVRNFAVLSSRHQEILCDLAKALASPAEVQALANAEES